MDISARKSSESTLREERDWFANVVATVPVVICSFRRRRDGSVHFPFANRRLEHIYALRAEDLARDASPIFARMHPDDADRVRDSIEESARALSVWRAEFRVRNPARGDIWVEGHSVPALESNGDILWQGYVTDITERKSTAETLQAAETSLQLMIEGVSDHAIFMLDPTGRILTWNKGAERIDGYSADEILGRNFSCLFTPQAIAAGKPQLELAEAAANGKADVDGWRVRKNGSRFWANGTVAALYDDRRQVRGFAKVTRDLTAKRRNDELLRSVLDHTLDGIIGIDEQGIISMINRAGETIFGRSEAEVIGNNVRMLMPTPYHAEHDSYLTNYLRTGEAKIIGIGREVRGLRKDGSIFPIDLAVTEFRLDNQRFFVGIVRDISERKTLETQLRQSQKMEAFGQLAGGVAHDFNNLLTVISGYSDILLTTLPPDDVNREMIDEIRRAGDRATSLTRQLLAFTRQQVLEPRIVDLNEILKDTESMLRRLIGEDVQFASVLREDISSVTVDPGQMEQVLLNLAVNARDAMPRGGKLTIETNEVDLLDEYVRQHPDARAGRFVMLAISDTGSGMTAEVKSRIFEPFFTTKGGKGTGLGLAVVQGVVKQSGGAIEVYSEAGVGTTFKIYLPASSGERSMPVEPLLQRSPRGRETILLVEDEEGVRQLAVVALQRFGYQVLTAPSGKAALQFMAAHHDEVHLLVTDVVMPGMSGRQLAETLQETHSGLKVLFLSGYTDDAVVRHGVLQANVAFLQKPFTPASLARKVREVLDNG
jgi:PAS domain S-box-containing protein